MKKKALALSMALALAVGVLIAPMSANAANQEVTSAQTVTATVSTQTGGDSGSDGSAFVVAIPQEIELSRSSYITFSGSYTVGVKAVLASGKKVSVTPASTFDMTDGINTYTANVTQTNTVWVGADETAGTGELNASVSNYVTTDGAITVDIEKTGDYEGDLGFTVALN